MQEVESSVAPFGKVIPQGELQICATSWATFTKLTADQLLIGPNGFVEMCSDACAQCRQSSNEVAQPRRCAVRDGAALLT